MQLVCLMYDTSIMGDCSYKTLLLGIFYNSQFYTHKRFYSSTKKYLIACLIILIHETQFLHIWFVAIYIIVICTKILGHLIISIDYSFS